MRSIQLGLTCLPLMLLLGCTDQHLPQFDIPEPITVPSGKPAFGPRLAKGAGETLVLSWMEPGDSGGTLKYSVLDRGDWQAPSTVVTDDNLFLNWADKPAVTPLGSRHLFAHWMSKVADSTYAYQVLTAFSVDGGKTWTPPTRAHDDDSATEHGFVSVYSSAKGAGLAWLDGRETPAGGMTLRAASIDSGGVPANETLVDGLVCDCCQTDITATSSNPVLVYRDRTEAEIRDIAVARLVDGVWQPGGALPADGWEISGCPVNGPAIDAIDDRLAIAWFTAANDWPKIQAVTSTNAGRSFSQPVTLASYDVTGHVGIAMLDENTLAVSWTEPDDDGSYEINVRSMTFNGQLSRKLTVGRTSLSRTVPQMARVGGDLIFAWTDTVGDVQKVASVKVSLLGFYD